MFRCRVVAPDPLIKVGLQLGEINTLRGKVNWMAARQASIDSDLFGNDISKLWPISYEGQSDTACFDNALEFLVRGGYPLAHAMMMLIPEAWAGNPFMDDDRRAFYEYHAALMEPWDGPAAVCFTDGRQIGATLDRNGLRPARYLVTDDGLVVLASEMGVLPIPEERIVEKWRLQPGRMLLIDLEQGRIVSDDEIKATLATAHPYRDWLKRDQIVLEELLRVKARESRTDVSLLDRQQAFGYSQEDLKRSCSRWPSPARRRSARWERIRRSRRSPTNRSCSTPTSSRTSPRSRTRRSIRSARNSS